MKKVIIPVLLLFGFLNLSCSAYKTLMNISRLQFKLGKVNNLEVAGIPVNNQTKLNDFNAMDMLRITANIAKKQLPVSFRLNVLASNPNDGTGGFPRTDVTIKSFPWRLLIDNKETVSGNISAPISVPGTGENTSFAIQINLDLFKFFGNKEYQSLLNLALNLDGKGSSPSKLTLYAQPTVSSVIGDIKYPQELKIVDVSFTN